MRDSVDVSLQAIIAELQIGWGSMRRRRAKRNATGENEDCGSIFHVRLGALGRLGFLEVIGAGNAQELSAFSACVSEQFRGQILVGQRSGHGFLQSADLRGAFEGFTKARVSDGNQAS